ncbi:NitT/TauT family transport system ATP-binding protein [Rhizobium sp. BK313]|uniref:ABC transporter ATP-binding protein n=1 Tax=Rhizobium sp. BK313 TaxID=2587081 RepID=UPI00105F0499|nr:ABC transporter ATP-binding protein [Rhizobium sp. BK313]MBB3458311.1 NitT/TauT family transport system ATP-binding protein [Rhizobium sp. BK313]
MSHISTIGISAKRQASGQADVLTLADTSPEAAAIEIDHCIKKFRLGSGPEMTALADVSLKIRSGEFVAIIGPSGCGKSTVLRLIASLEQPTSGHVSIKGNSPSELADQHRLGVAFQDHALLPWLTTEQNIALPYRLAGKKTDHDRVKDLIRLIGLAGFEKARPKQMSGGMRQRVSIARALVLKPEVLLLDEPFGALDAVTRRQMNIELQRTWTELRTTTLLVTHSVDEALFLADRIFVMTGRPGRVLQEVSVPFARPRTPEIMRSEEFHRLVDSLTLALEPHGAPQ